MKQTARILVIDDDTHVREALLDELSQYYSVEAAACGSDAFRFLTSHEYDVVISDLKMPDHDGIEVLEFAREHQKDPVRVLLTGYLDDRAQRALMAPNAPYKVGKPWHDEIEVVVRRGLEQRELTRRLNASVVDALRISTLDSELAGTTSPQELVEAVVRRAVTIDGVIACGVVIRADSVEQPVIGSIVPVNGPGWYVDLPLDDEGTVRLRVRGVGESAREIIQYMAHRAQRTLGVLDARAGMSLLQLLHRGTKVNQLMRQATVGALSASLLHDLASTMQALHGALDRLLGSIDHPEVLRQAAEDANQAGAEAVQLFVQMRKFIREGEVTRKRIDVRAFVKRLCAIVATHVYARATLQVGEIPEAYIYAGESLFLHVLANVLRNAANASPAGGLIDLDVRVVDDYLEFVVTDDGPGVAPEIADTMFEPFASTTANGTGLGLAMAAYVMENLGGRIRYRKVPNRGACFTVSLPVVTR